MSFLPSSVDVAIIGAGAAGLGAANALKNSGLSVLVLEARDRVGGRAHTIMASPDVTFDVGCGWLHSADQNSFVKIAEDLNFEINKALPPWRERAYGKAFPQDDRDDFIRALNAFYDRAEQAAQEAERSGRDSAASLYLEPGNRWNPMIDAISTYINGCELDQVSILDMDAYEDTDLNWRIRRGYGAMIAAYGASCPLALNCTVTLIDHSAKRVRIETSQGTLTADKVIVTVPTNLIADEAIRFHPPLPAKVDAARGLPLGLADKVTLALWTSRRRCRKKAICAPPPCAPQWAPITSARSASPASKVFSAAALRNRWKTPAPARSPQQASTRSCRSSATISAAS